MFLLIDVTVPLNVFYIKLPSDEARQMSSEKAGQRVFRWTPARTFGNTDVVVAIVANPLSGYFVKACFSGGPNTSPLDAGCHTGNYSYLELLM